jgi:molybdate transport system substrate-binding protein
MTRPRWPFRRGLAPALGAVLLVVSACGSTPPTPSADAQPDAATRTLTVFAAASLKNAFTEVGGTFEGSHPGTSVTFSFAGSADLVSQLQAGAPADVFASADTTNMDKAQADRLLLGDPVPFASNTLQIAVPPDNPAGISSLADLGRAGVKLVTCAPGVPCGAATQRVARAAGVTLRPVSEETSVTDVLNKVQSGEADAGLVYVTDVTGAQGKVRGVAFPESAKAVNHYPIAVLAAGKQQDLAREFVELVTGPQGQRVLSAAGFAQP